MFRTAELGRTISKADYDRLAEPLRIELLGLQQRLREARCPVVVVFAGVEGAGKGESINLINEWLDPRWIVTNAYGPKADVERERPEFWRYWRDLPAHGQIGLFLSCWYSEPFKDFALGNMSEQAFDNRMQRILAFEHMLADDGAVVLKFWMHLGKDAQKKRLKDLSKDPLQAWRVTQEDKDNTKRYDDFIEAAERVIRKTSVAEARWHIVEGSDHRYRSITVLNLLRDTIKTHLDAHAAREAGKTIMASPVQSALGSEDEAEASETEALEAALQTVQGKQPSILDSLDLSLTLGKKDYNHRLKIAQARLAELSRTARERGVSTVLVFEGWDAAGKGGAIRRCAAAMDARSYRIIPVAAPTDEEKVQHYLWRFWRHISRSGRVTIFDRSWYGRVLVERVEGFASDPEWRRAYSEIRDFEEQLVEHGTVLGKFWIHISKEEQLARFEARAQIPYKAWKLTEEDWRNRDKWDLYEDAVTAMVERTSSSVAPWTLVEGNDKRHARVRVIETVCAALEKRLEA
ncbi:MAG: polyphosphate kinase [Rhodospirillaceae bacterium]